MCLSIIFAPLYSNRVYAQDSDATVATTTEELLFELHGTLTSVFTQLFDTTYAPDGWTLGLDEKVTTPDVYTGTNHLGQTFVFDVMAVEALPEGEQPLTPEDQAYIEDTQGEISVAVGFLKTDLATVSVMGLCVSQVDPSAGFYSRLVIMKELYLSPPAQASTEAPPLDLSDDPAVLDESPIMDDDTAALLMMAAPPDVLAQAFVDTHQAVFGTLPIEDEFSLAIEGYFTGSGVYSGTNASGESFTLTVDQSTALETEGVPCAPTDASETEYFGFTGQLMSDSGATAAVGGIATNGEGSSQFVIVNEGSEVPALEEVCPCFPIPIPLLIPYECPTYRSCVAACEATYEAEKRAIAAAYNAAKQAADDARDFSLAATEAIYAAGLIAAGVELAANTAACLRQIASQLRVCFMLVASWWFALAAVACFAAVAVIQAVCIADAVATRDIKVAILEATRDFAIAQAHATHAAAIAAAGQAAATAAAAAKAARDACVAGCERICWRWIIIWVCI